MNSKFFDIDELDELQADQQPEDKSGILSEAFLSTHEHRIESIKNLSGRFPHPGEIFFLWTVNSFNAFTFIPYLIHQCGIIDELVLSTYSINIRIIDALVKLIDRGKILSAQIFISDSIKSRLPKVFDHLCSQVEKRSGVVLVNYAWNHSKIALIRCGDSFFDVEGSGNWGENAQHEQYIFLNSRKVFEFRKNEIIHGSHP